MYPSQVPGDLSLVGDNFDNNITIQPSTNAATPNTFTISAGTAANGKTTQLQLNGVPVASPCVVGQSGNLVTGDISVNLGTGQNNLLFGFTTAPVTTPDPVQGNVTITDNANDANVIDNVDLMSRLTILNGPSTTNTVQNTISNVQVDLATTINNGGNTTTNISNSQLLAGLDVASPAVPVVLSSLTVNTCTVVGNVVVANVGGGNTSTTVEGGWVEGTLTVVNGDGINSVQVGTSTAPTKIGTSPVSPTPPTPTVISIINGDGGSFTQFLGQSATSRLTVMGGILVVNGASTAGATNMVSFNNADAAGRVTVDNGGTPGVPSIENSVSIQDSNLGILALTAASPNPVTIANGTGYDAFSMTSINSACTAPWGVAIDNIVNGLNASTVWGSSTTVTGSSIGTGVFGPNDGTAGNGFDLTGDNGNDVVAISSSTINGNTNLFLNGGSNKVCAAYEILNEF
jgi:hypothetical protein